MNIKKQPKFSQPFKVPIVARQAGTRPAKLSPMQATKIRAKANRIIGR